MKKLLFLILMCKALQGEAQVIVKGSLELKDSTISREIPFTITKGTPKLLFSADGFLTNGSLKVYLTNPAGKQNDGFQLTSEPNGEGHERPSKGELGNSASYPLPGIWKLNIYIKNATGKLTYQIKTKEL